MYDQALEAGRKRDYGSAIRLLTQVAAGTDQYPQALLYLGRAYHASGDFGPAAQVLRFYIKTVPDSGPGRFFLARTYIALDLPDRAVGLLKFVVAQTPDFAPALGLLGYALLKLRRSTAAVAYLEQALNIDRDNPRYLSAYLNALMIKGVHRLRAGDLDEAESIFDFVVKQNPESLLPRIYLARAHRDRGDLDLAARDYAEAGRIAPHDPVLPVLQAICQLSSANGSEQALRDLARYFGLEPSAGSLPSDQMLLQKLLAFSLFREGRLRDAVRCGRTVLRAEYHDADLHVMMAQSYLNLGDYQRARNHFERALQYGPAGTQVLHGLSLALWRLGEYEALIRICRRVVRLNPSDNTGRYFLVLARAQTEPGPDLMDDLRGQIRTTGPDASLMSALARVYLASELDELALGWLQKTLKLDPQDLETHGLLIETLKRLGRHESLVKAYQDYLALASSDQTRRRELVNLLLDAEDFAEAAVQIRVLLPHSPGNRTLRKNLAHCYLMLKRHGDAAILYRELLRDQPDSIPFLRALVLCLDREGREAEAIAFLTTAGRHFGEHPDILLPLGVLLIKQHKYLDAQVVFRKVLANDPHDWRAHHNLGRAYEKTGQKAFAKRFFQNAKKYRG